MPCCCGLHDVHLLTLQHTTSSELIAHVVMSSYSHMHAFMYMSAHSFTHSQFNASMTQTVASCNASIMRYAAIGKCKLTGAVVDTTYIGDGACALVPHVTSAGLLVANNKTNAHTKLLAKGKAWATGERARSSEVPFTLLI